MGRKVYTLDEKVYEKGIVPRSSPHSLFPSTPSWEKGRVRIIWLKAFLFCLLCLSYCTIKQPSEQEVYKREQKTHHNQKATQQPCHPRGLLHPALIQRRWCGGAVWLPLAHRGGDCFGTLPVLPDWSVPRLALDITHCLPLVIFGLLAFSS